MSDLIRNSLEKCVGCNRCIRVCPIEEANIAFMDNNVGKVRMNPDKCITCGACIITCRHESRYFIDDTDKFFDDLKRGVPISVFCAPASRANLENWSQVLAMLRRMGAQQVYDVSLGADICTWAHIRYIQKYGPASVITQPCPAIVDYVLMHANHLLSYLSPIHSPMMCTAIYMRKYQGITDKIAAISPCIAKRNEFEQTGHLVSYNVTFTKLYEYITQHSLTLPAQGSDYDHQDSVLGSIYSMPGGLKENVEFMLGKGLRIDKSEGQSVVYNALKEFGREDKANLPQVFDVLNCPEGCNLGTGCRHDRSTFVVNSAMQEARSKAVEGRDRIYFEQLYRLYDQTLDLNDFIRHYKPTPARSVKITEQDLENAYVQLDKLDQASRLFDCGACGSDTCHEMARKIAKGVNNSRNCLQKTYNDMYHEHAAVVSWQHRNDESIQSLGQDMTSIKDLSDDIVSNVVNVDKVIGLYDSLAKDINKIAMHIHMISLNASIEAARAGNHGASFAVIAQAIRSLASDTQEAITNITRASGDAKTAVGGISRMVVTIGDAISKCYSHIRELSSNTQDLLENDKDLD